MKLIDKVPHKVNKYRICSRHVTILDSQIFLNQIENFFIKPMIVPNRGKPENSIFSLVYFCHFLPIISIIHLLGVQCVQCPCPLLSMVFLGPSYSESDQKCKNKPAFQASAYCSPISKVRISGGTQKIFCGRV